ncbi:MAG TPA: sigma-70 family RNA polymerase sigma factor [Solirubrobacteraceae bacterium]
MAPSVSSGESSAPAARAVGSDTQHWVEGLRSSSPHFRRTTAELHALLLRVARYELGRRRHALGSIGGPELDDLAQQSASDAMLSILSKLEEFRGASRFTTWAYKFVIFDVSAKVAGHAWRHHRPEEEPAWEQVPDAFAAQPVQSAERREQLTVLSQAINSELTDRQRQVFVAVALNDVSIDVLALKLGSNRNALYKNLFDARRKLRACLAAAGYPLPAEEVSS